MFLAFTLSFTLVHLFVHVNAQVSLPSLPYLPPNSSSGAIPSSPKKPNSQWSALLGNVLYFYDAQRSGKLPSTNRVPWRNDSALTDGRDAGVDLSGGYFDAGDYVKCTFPLSFTLMSICWGASDFGPGFDNANQTAYLDSTIRWGMDWLINAHPHPRTLFVQVADSKIDTNYWGGDQNIPGPRPSFQINDSSPGTDAAAQAAAAFAACSLLYSQGRTSRTSAPASLANTSYAQSLLTHAAQLYDFALNASGGQRTYQTSVPQVAETYPSTSYGDDLAIAALFLSLTNTSAALANTTVANLSIANLSPAAFYNQAETFWSQYALAGEDGVFNWDNKAPALPVLFVQAALARPEVDVGHNVSAWQAVSEGYFDRIVGGKGRGSMTKGGLLWYDGDSDEASLNPALNAAMLMARYAPVASSPDKTAAYQNFVQSQMDYALGKNPMSAPYVVGSNPNSPSNPHSALASGAGDINAIDANPAQEAYVLYGGVVGGPDRNDNFYDIRSDWPQTEISLDYVAPMLSLVAYNVIMNPNDPYYTSLQAGAYAQHKPSGTPCDAVFDCSPGGLPDRDKVIIGVVVSVVGLALLLLALYWIWLCLSSRRRHKLKG